MQLAAVMQRTTHTHGGGLPTSGRRISSAHVASCCATRCTLPAASRSRVEAARPSLQFEVVHGVTIEQMQAGASPATGRVSKRRSHSFAPFCFGRCHCSKPAAPGFGTMLQ